jgi:hypothetical protein
MHLDSSQLSTRGVHLGSETDDSISICRSVLLEILHNVAMKIER